MATTLYLRDTAPVLVPPLTASLVDVNVRDASRAVTPGAQTFYGSQGWGYSLSETIGTGVGSNPTTPTVAGPTAGVFLGGTTTPRSFTSPPLAADVTISGTVSLRACGLESSMNANTSFRYAIYRVDAEGALTLISNSQSSTELGTSGAARNWTDTPTSTDMKKGDRILVLVMLDDAGGNMASGHTITFSFSGSNANNADSYVQFDETLSFITSAPSGTSYYLRDSASSVNPGSATEKELLTTQGSGTATAVHTTLAGPLTFPGDQWTVSAGGADVEWYTPQLAAFTLGGVVQADVGKPSRIESVFAAAPYDTLNIEIAVVDGDGTNPVVWARSALFASQENTASISSYYLSGADLSVAEGQRLRLRFYSDDYITASNDQDSGTDRTIRYDGTGSYASRLVFTQTITEAATTINVTPAAAVATTTVPTPTLSLGAVNVIPTTAVATGTPKDAVIPVLGLPTPATAIGTALDATLAPGAVSAVPSSAVAAGTALDPTLDLALALTPDSAVATGTALEPTADSSAPIVAGPSSAVATGTALDATVALGAVTVTPDAANAAGTALDPTLALAFTALPAAALATGTTPDVALALGEVTVIPDPAIATAVAPTPTISSGEVTVQADLAVVAVTAPLPSLALGDLAALVDVGIVTVSAMPPTLALGDVTLLPDGAMATGVIPTPTFDGAVAVLPSAGIVTVTIPTPTGVIRATWYLLSGTVGSGWGELQLNGSPPAAGTLGTGWDMAGVASGQFSRLSVGTVRAPGTFSGTAQPSSGPDSGLHDAWRTADPLTYDFDPGDWSFALAGLAVLGEGADARLRVRLWKSSDPDGASPTELTSGAVVGTSIIDLTTSVEQQSVGSVALGGVTLSNEYLFLQLAVETV